MSKDNKISRREFLSRSAMAGVAGAIGLSPILSACAGDKKNAYVALKLPANTTFPNCRTRRSTGKNSKPV